MVTISDGEENASSDYKGEEGRLRLRKLIEEKTAAKNWTFAYMGANQDVTAIARSLSIPLGNTMVFSSTGQGMNIATTSSNSALRTYSTSLSVNNASSDSYFSGAISSPDVDATNGLLSKKVK